MLSDGFIQFYLIGNLLSSYIIYKFFQIFFKSNISNIKIDIIVYCSYFIATSAVYIDFNIPILTMMTNLVFLLFITCLYETTMQKRITAVALVYTVSLLIESSIVLIGKSLHWSELEILSVIISRIILLIIIQILQTNRDLKDEILIPRIQWFSIIIFPLGSIMLFLNLIDHIDGFSLILTCIILLAFDFTVFYIFNKMNYEYKKSMDEKLELQEKKIEARIYLTEKNVYENQLKMVEESNKKLRTLKHDLKAYYFALKTDIQEKNYDEAINNLDRMIPNTIYNEQYVDVGNVTVTSILNYYIGEARKNNVHVTFETKIPNELNIDSYDLSTILVNLLQNAIEALENCKNNKELIINLHYERNMLFIMIENTHNNSNLKNEKDLVTSKKDREEHGIGIYSVKKSVSKYDGEIEYQFFDDRVKVFVLLYNNLIKINQAR